MTAPPIGPVHARSDCLTACELQQCAELLGETSDRPLGVAFVLALRTLIESRVLPDGGIMLSHRATWFCESWAGVYRTAMSIISTDPPRTRYQRVVIGYRTTDENGKVFVEQEQEVLWPNTK